MAGRTNRAQRRAMRRKTGALVHHRIVIEGAAVSEAVAQGANPVDLVMFHVDEALRVLIDQGGQPLAHSVITIGEHPDYPGCLTVEAKTDVLLERRTCRVCGCTDDDCSQCIARTGEPCSWVAADLCSACEPDLGLVEDDPTGEQPDPAA